MTSSLDCKLLLLHIDWNFITPWDSRAVLLSGPVYCSHPVSVYCSFVFLRSWPQKAKRFWIISIFWCNNDSVGSKMELMMERHKIMCIGKACALRDSISNTNSHVRLWNPDASRSRKSKYATWDVTEDVCYVGRPLKIQIQLPQSMSRLSCHQSQGNTFGSLRIYWKEYVFTKITIVLKPD